MELDRAVHIGQKTSLFLRSLLYQGYSIIDFYPIFNKCSQKASKQPSTLYHKNCRSLCKIREQSIQMMMKKQQKYLKCEFCHNLIPITEVYNDSLMKNWTTPVRIDLKRFKYRQLQSLTEQIRDDRSMQNIQQLKNSPSEYREFSLPQLQFSHLKYSKCLTSIKNKQIPKQHRIQQIQILNNYYYYGMLPENEQQQAEPTQIVSSQYRIEKRLTTVTDKYIQDRCKVSQEVNKRYPDFIPDFSDQCHAIAKYIHTKYKLFIGEEYQILVRIGEKNESGISILLSKIVLNNLLIVIWKYESQTKVRVSTYQLFPQILDIMINPNNRTLLDANAEVILQNTKENITIEMCSNDNSLQFVIFSEKQWQVYRIMSIFYEIMIEKVLICQYIGEQVDRQTRGVSISSDGQVNWLSMQIKKLGQQLNEYQVIVKEYNTQIQQLVTTITLQSKPTQKQVQSASIKFIKEDKINQMKYLIAQIPHQQSIQIYLIKYCMKTRKLNIVFLQNQHNSECLQYRDYKISKWLLMFHSQHGDNLKIQQICIQ